MIKELEILKEKIIKEIREKGYSTTGKLKLREEFAHILKKGEKSSEILKLVNVFMEENNIKLVSFSLEGDNEYLYDGKFEFANVEQFKEHFKID